MTAVAERHARSVLFRTVLRLLLAANRQLIARLRADDGSCKLEDLRHEAGAARLLGDRDGELSQHNAAVSAAPVDDEPATAASASDAPAALLWEQLVCSVPYAKVQAEWLEVAKSEKRPTDSNYLDTLLDSLADASLLSVRQDAGAAGRCVWPASAAQMVFGHSGSVTIQMLEGLARTLQPTVRLLRDTGDALRWLREFP